ncbi:hypothetical protein AMTR_s00033p00238160 [Amborella trichopoda]|uniref:Uncharacterized protein n=1 Tax=Amborella trichopoda TaxID=13333 RepID=U5CW94_AMBTC|nr:hypothetical protein AMTR_s00033p00238160 [Amborella trichopoda]
MVAGLSQGLRAQPAQAPDILMIGEEEEEVVVGCSQRSTGEDDEGREGNQHDEHYEEEMAR